MPLRSAPKEASVAQPMGAETEGKLFAPAAARNAAPISDALRLHAPPQGHALEIASGTGQHVAQFAAAMPGLIWQPTDVDPSRCQSIHAYVQDYAQGANQAAVQGSGQGASQAPCNIAAPQILDATTENWAAALGQFDLLFLANLLHLISARDVSRVLSGMAAATAAGGRVAIYGPFLRDGKTTSEGDANFHATLRRHDPEIGYKDLREVKAELAANGLSLLQHIDMPANNVMIWAERPG